MRLTIVFLVLVASCLLVAFSVRHRTQCDFQLWGRYEYDGTQCPFDDVVSGAKNGHPICASVRIYCY